MRAGRALTPVETKNLPGCAMNNSINPAPQLSRRHFLKSSSVAAAGMAALAEGPFVVTAHAAPDDPIRIGLIGCGGRGTGAVADALGAATDVNYPQAGYPTQHIQTHAKASSKNVKVIALADAFADRLDHRRHPLGKLSMNT